MSGIGVGQCSRCGRLAFPTPLVCHRCGSVDWGSRILETGVVEQRARIQHAVGGAPGDVILALVRLDAGPRVVAGIPDGVQDGAAVRVSSTAAGIRGEPVA